MKKFKKKEIIALTVIGVLILSILGVWAGYLVSSLDKSNRWKENTNPTAAADFTFETETQAETVEEGTEKIVGGESEESEETEAATTKKNDTDKNEDSNTQSTTKATSSNTTATQATTAKKKPTNSTNPIKKPTPSTRPSNTTPTGNPVEQIKPATTPVDTNKKTLSINGTKCNVGNTIEIVLDLEVPEILENFQGITQYDSKYLQFVSIEGNVSGSMFNNKDGVIYYNGSDIGAGFNFTQKGSLYKATFKVLKAGSTNIVNTFEVLNDRNSKPINPKGCNVTIGVYNKK